MHLDKMFSLEIFIKNRVPVSFLASCIPYLEFDASAHLGGDNFGGILYSNGGIPSLHELVFSIFEENIRLSYSCSPNEYKFKHVVKLIFILAH